MVEVWPPIRLAVPTCFHEALQVGHREQRRGGPLKKIIIIINIFKLVEYSVIGKYSRN
jgi:hypothetical protein